MVGHLGELALSSTSIAISLSSVTGFSLIMGMSSALETLCGQAYGAQQYKKFGNQIYTAILSLLIVCIPLAIFWKYTETILIFVGQSPSISHEAGKFITYLIPALFAYAVLQPLVRYFQMQSMLLPMLASSAVALCLHIPLCWALVYKTSLGNIGAAISIGVAMWSNAIFLLFYMLYSPSCAKTRSLISVEVFYGMRQFFSFAIPSAVMICLELWSYEFIVLLSGLLPNPELETSVLAIWYAHTLSTSCIPFGLLWQDLCSFVVLWRPLHLSTWSVPPGFVVFFNMFGIGSAEVDVCFGISYLVNCAGKWQEGLFEGGMFIDLDCSFTNEFYKVTGERMWSDRPDPSGHKMKDRMEDQMECWMKSTCPKDQSRLR
ncbi:MATE efflux family protein [Artemisia annua]|uniref:MATE efflux family protein n=1 Tax=Artemisia annua TaxID=35608 RepID=A0A2U1PGJ3_ARTAN|nr:MATE efflux family protein [Artemisia annua]